MSYKCYITIIDAITTSICVIFGLHQFSNEKSRDYQNNKKQNIIKSLQKDGYDYYTACKKATEIIDDDYLSLQKNLISSGSPSFNELARFPLRLNSIMDED